MELLEVEVERLKHAASFLDVLERRCNSLNPVTTSSGHPLSVGTGSQTERPPHSSKHHSEAGSLAGGDFCYALVHVFAYHLRAWFSWDFIYSSVYITESENLAGYACVAAHGR